jgi:hypothetical protein
MMPRKENGKKRQKQIVKIMNDRLPSSQSSLPAIRPFPHPNNPSTPHVVSTPACAPALLDVCFIFHDRIIRFRIGSVVAGVQVLSKKIRTDRSHKNSAIA